MKKTFEKSIVAAKTLPAGKVIVLEDLAYKKPGDGIKAMHFRELIGKKLEVSVEKDTKLSWGMFQKK
jgi:sialic acid synthase SpsE